MFKFAVAIKKELLQLLADRAGLSLLFIMPLLLVFIITIVQDSAYRVVNENVISILITNKDKGENGEKLIHSLSESGLFSVQRNDDLNNENIRSAMNEENALTAFVIPQNFSERLEAKAIGVSNLLMKELQVQDSIPPYSDEIPDLNLYYDPVLQEQYCQSIVNVIHSHVEILQSSLMIDAVFKDVGFEGTPENLRDMMMSDKANINQMAAFGETEKRPNSTQHNVPAWTIFAMFFMVVSLGGNFVRERKSGSFLRLRSMPTSMTLVLTSKIAVYVMVGILQVVLIFTVAYLSFPALGLPELSMPTNILGFAVVVIMSSLAAVSFALLLGSLASSQVQANGAGAATVVIFAALGGVWVPTFVMPEYLQTISMFSPLNWCLDGFYTLFLRDGNWAELAFPLLFIFIFILACQAVMLAKMKIEKLI